MALFETAPTGARMIVPALLAAAAAGGGYGAASTFVAVIQLKALALAFIALALFGLFSLIGRNVLMNLIVGLIGGAAAVLALWFGWYWMEFGQKAAMGFLTSGPYGMYKTLVNLSANYVYTMDDSTSDMGSMMTQLIWGGETALFGLSPVAGALMARRRARRVEGTT
jgi:hypothetical protein